MKNKQRENVQLHRRASVVSINFPHASVGLPTEISFLEEEVITDSDGVEKVIDGTAGRSWDLFTLEGAGEEFQLYDMITEEKIEGATATYGDIATLLYSLYFHVSAKTDARNEAELAEQAALFADVPVEEPEVPEE